MALTEQPFTLGVRLDVDFDGFFRREDASAQLKLWRKAIATSVLGLASPHQLQLRRVRRGSLDLEFEVEVGSGVSDAELQRRLNQEADRLRALFQEPLLEVRVGADAGNAGQGSGRGSSSPRPAATEGRSELERRCPSPRLQDRISRAESGYGWDTPDAPLSFRELRERLRAAESEYGLHLPLEERFALADASARPFLERPPQWSQPSAEHPKEWPSTSIWQRFNHPTVAVEGPRFLMGDSYWEQRQGNRIREQREALIKRGLLHEEPEVVPFKAKPVPVSVYAPRPQAQVNGRLGRSMEREEEEQPFRARPVPWRVSTPLYDQLLVEEREARQNRQRTRSLQMLRSASLPPRLEAAARARRDRQDAQQESPRPFQSWHGEAYSARRWRAEAQKVSRDVGPTLGLSENSYGSQGAAVQGQRPRGPQRPQSAPRPHWERDIPREPSTTEVPDFAARHERIKRQLERRKYMTRGVTQPEPFVFNTPTRSQSRHPSMPKDPRRDWRYHRPMAPGPTAPVAPVRSTEKVTSYQQATRKKLQERRVKEMKEREELKEAQAPNQEVKFRVMQAMGRVEPLEQKIERIVSDKRRGLQRTQREKEEDLRSIMERANSRPLLMQQADSLVRAKRRALFRVRNALRQAGVRNVNRHFADDELEEMDRAEDQKESYGYTVGTEPLTGAVTQGSLFRP